MDALERLKLRTEEPDEFLLFDCLESAKAAILARRYPYGEYPTELPARYADLQYRVALDLYNKIGAEGQTAHSENGISRSWGSEWVSDELLREVVPLVGCV